MLIFASPSIQDVNWTYVRRSEEVQDVFRTSYVRSIYVLCPGVNIRREIWRRSLILSAYCCITRIHEYVGNCQKRIHSLVKHLRWSFLWKGRLLQLSYIAPNNIVLSNHPHFPKISWIYDNSPVSKIFCNIVFLSLWLFCNYTNKEKRHEMKI